MSGEQCSQAFLPGPMSYSDISGEKCWILQMRVHIVGTAACCGLVSCCSHLAIELGSSCTQRCEQEGNCGATCFTDHSVDYHLIFWELFYFIGAQGSW